VSRRSIQDWEAGLNYPEAQHLQALILAFLVRITVNSYSWNGSVESVREFRHRGINVGTGIRAVSGHTGRLSGNTAQAARL